MKIVLTGTNHLKADADLDVIIKYEGEDTWTFKGGKMNFSISDLTTATKFLREQGEK